MAYINGRKVLQVIKTTAAPASYQTKTITPSNFTPIVLPDAGYQALSKVIINGILVDPHYNYLTITDADLAYTKTIPVGALENGLVDYLGGITYKVNQLVNISSNNSYRISGATGSFVYSTDYKKVTFTFTGDQTSLLQIYNYNLISDLPMNVGHKYLQVALITSSINAVITLRTYPVLNGANFTLTSNTPKLCSFINTAIGQNQDNREIGIISRLDNQTYHTGDTIVIENMTLIDLTDMGIDTTDVDVAKAELLKRGINVAEYNPYDAGSLKYNEPRSVKVNNVSLYADEIAAIRHYIVDDLGYDEYVLGYGIDKDNCNYIDFENKKVVIKYARVDLGTLNWNYESSQQIFYAFVNGIKSPSEGTTKGNILNQKYTNVSRSSLTNSGEIAVSTNAYINIKDTSYNDAAAFKTAMSGVYLVYELATPIKIDISDLLESALIQPLEVGGVITLENDYDAAIPSSITYLVEE